ncbi:MAG: ATP-binding protein [Thermodesulfobacteriota bacterium]
MEVNPDVNPDVNLLLDAFNTFKKASSTLENSYKVLEMRAEELDLELKEKNNFLTSVMEGLPVGVLVTDDAGIIRSVNNSACLILSETEDELIEAGFQGKLKALDSAFAFDLSDKHLKAMETGDEQVTIKTGDNEKKTITINATVLTNLQGERTGYLLVIRDISEIKRLRESSQRDKRLSAMGEMAASIAHQIRNPLGSIELFASLLKNELSGNEESQKFAGEIIHAVRTLNNTLSNMLLFANTSSPRKSSVSLDEFVLDIQGVFHFLMVDRSVSFEVVNEAAGLDILMDRELMKQALLNLIINGSDAVADIDSASVALSIKRAHGKMQFSVTDNGTGIAEGDADKVFNPFFTSKARGTGLGLTVVSNIVKSHGGFIDLESTSENGTTFSITLPMDVEGGSV